MKKRFALAAALAFSIIPIASIEEAKASHDYKEVKSELNRLTNYDDYVMGYPLGFHFVRHCYNKKNEDVTFLLLKANKYDKLVVKFDNGKKFYRGHYFEEAKKAYIRQYKNKCTHNKKDLKKIKKQQSQ